MISYNGDIPRLYTALAQWLACVCYFPILKRRFSKGKSIFLAAGLLAVQSWFLTMTSGLPTVLWVIGMLLSVLLMLSAIFFLYQIPFPAAVFCCSGAFLLAETIASLEWQIHVYIVEILGFSGWYVQLLILAGVYGAGCLLAVRLEKGELTGDALSELTWSEVFTCVCVVGFIFFFSNMSYVADSSPFSATGRTDIFIVRTLVDLGGILLLLTFQSQTAKYRTLREQSIMQSALRRQYEQYRNYQESLEMIQIKYHDLKHHIEALRAQTDSQQRREYLDLMEKELNEDSLQIKTGHPVLDTILASKALSAHRQNVQITCVADGALLGFMHVTDICTIFGNALDNAIESVVMLDDLSRRLIHVIVSSQKDFVFIRISNYCEKPVEFEPGELPATTKQDRQSHGFGLKSIRCTAEKYGGSLDISMKDNWFELSILIPQRQGAAG